MQEIVIDTSIGGFSLGQVGREWLFDTARDAFFRKVPDPSSAMFSPDGRAYKSEFLGEGYVWSVDLWALQGPGGTLWHFNSGMSDEDLRAREEIVRAVRVCEPEDKADPQVVSIPGEVEWTLETNDAGQEFVREKSRTWP